MHSDLDTQDTPYKTPRRCGGVVSTDQSRIDKSLGDEASTEDEIRQAAEDRFQAIIEALRKDATSELSLDDDHRTRVADERDLTLADWRFSWKLEWDADSFSGNEDASIPAR